jgi:hypothetical protein
MTKRCQTTRGTQKKQTTPRKRHGGNFDRDQRTIGNT